MVPNLSIKNKRKMSKGKEYFDIDNPEFRKEMLVRVMTMSSINDARIRVIGHWLSDKSDLGYYEHEGELERSVRRAKAEAVQEVGELILEVLRLDHDQLLAISIELQ
jgi:hypothetical protein